MLKRFVTTILTLLLWTDVASAGSADKIGSSQSCIMANYIQDAPVVDEHTILVRMNPGLGYKRIDLASDCATLHEGTGFSLDTSIGRLCVRDSLRVLTPGAQACVISKIVTIDDHEAHELMSKVH